MKLKKLLCGKGNHQYRRSSPQNGEKKCLISRTYRKQNKTRKHNLKMGYETKHTVFKRKKSDKEIFF